MCTSRICCCSATVVSIVFSFVGALMNAWPAVNAWWFVQDEYLTIWQNALIVILLISSGIIFAAVFAKIPELMYISILAQFLAIVTILGDGIYYMLYFGANTEYQTYLYSMYGTSFLVSIVVLHFHMCAQKQLFEQKYRAQKQPSIEAPAATEQAKAQQQTSPAQQQPPPAQPGRNQQPQPLQPQYLPQQYPPQQFQPQPQFQQYQPHQFQQLPPQPYQYQPQQYMPHAQLATAAGPPVRVPQQQQYQPQPQPQPSQTQQSKSQQQAGKKDK